VINGVPVLINEKNSVFSLEDFALRRDTTFHLQRSATEMRLLGLLDRARYQRQHRNKTTLRAPPRPFARPDINPFYLKYFDYYLASKPATIDAASGFYFLGPKAQAALSDRELIQYYKGALSN
jgi:hypothetical protein